MFLCKAASSFKDLGWYILFEEIQIPRVTTHYSENGEGSSTYGDRRKFQMRSGEETIKSRNDFLWIK